MNPVKDILDMAGDMRARGEPYALATVVRTLSLTAAKAGAKAVIRPDGSISGGWIGGGCARAAVLKAARDAIADGVPRLVSIQPKDLLESHGVAAGQAHEGVLYASNMCPSQGTMDVFVEPVLPRPALVVMGASPVAIATAELARRMGFAVTIAAPAAEHALFDGAERFLDGFALPDAPDSFVVIATQGKGDNAALKGALAGAHPYLGFVGSRKKAASLKAMLAGDGIAAEKLAQIRAPAGLDLGAINPDEIALSIVAEIIEVRRRGQRAAPV